MERGLYKVVMRVKQQKRNIENYSFSDRNELKNTFLFMERFGH